MPLITTTVSGCVRQHGGGTWLDPILFIPDTHEILHRQDDARGNQHEAQSKVNESTEGGGEDDLLQFFHHDNTEEERGLI
jgi:hypothetical protein